MSTQGEVPEEAGSRKSDGTREFCDVYEITIFHTPPKTDCNAVHYLMKIQTPGKLRCTEKDLLSNPRGYLRYLGLEELL